VVLNSFESFMYIQDIGYNGTCEPKHNFYTNFKIILEVHIIQRIILFKMSAKIHLNDRKYQIYPKVFETPTIQLIHILLHDKNVVEYI
jgi:hypothetical protein